MIGPECQSTLAGHSLAAAPVRVAGWAFVRPALDPGPLGMGGVDWWQLGLSMVSIAFWGLLLTAAASGLGVL